jgi:hypothetical protein
MKGRSNVHTDKNFALHRQQMEKNRLSVLHIEKQGCFPSKEGEKILLLDAGIKRIPYTYWNLLEYNYNLSKAE